MAYLNEDDWRKKKESERIRGLIKSGVRVEKRKLASDLRRNPPPSEKWFQRNWKLQGMLDEQDLFNRPSGPFIPDVLNSKYRYVIEVDGSVHETCEQIIRDEAKDRYFREMGFDVFRVRAFDSESFQKVVLSVLEKRRLK